MVANKLGRAALVAAMASSLLPIFAASGSASSGEVIKIRDNCDPTTFNAAIGPDTCVREGNNGQRVTFDRFIDRLFAGNAAAILESRNHLGWRFSPDETEVEVGDSLAVVNLGGEFHTFTDVTSTGFVGGCVPPLNAAFGLSPGPQCDDLNNIPGPDVFETSGIPAGATMTVTLSTPGTFLFECFIHPWMRTEITVEAD